MVMTLYPYNLYVRTPAASVVNSNGEFKTRAASWVFHSKCREVINGKGKVIRSASGTNIVYNALITMPLGTGLLKEGTEVAVIGGNSIDLDMIEKMEVGDENLRAKGVVINFHSSRLHCRLWI